MQHLILIKCQFPLNTVKSTDTKLQTFLDLLAPKQNGSFPLLQDIEITFLLLLRCFQ